MDLRSHAEQVAAQMIDDGSIDHNLIRDALLVFADRVLEDLESYSKPYAGSATAFIALVDEIARRRAALRAPTGDPAEPPDAEGEK